MTEKKKYIEFISKLSNLAAKKVSPVSTASAVNKLFKSYLNVNSVDFVIWDDNNMQLREFTDDWRYSNKEPREDGVNILYGNLAISAGKNFYFNENEFPCDTTKEIISEISSLIEKDNILIYPLVSNQEVFGLVKILLPQENIFTKDFFDILNTASKLLSGSLINYMLNEQMEVSLNFYKAMKDIAKIIESQYELSYIIPLIGEMIDRFMSAHLIYIFINKNDTYKLVWPVACKDNQVYKLLEQINSTTECIISEDSKIGIFPIINGSEVLGAIAAYSNIEKLLQKDIDYLVQLTRQSSVTIQRANVYAEVLKYATMDALTGLNNRRQFEIRLNQEVANSLRNKNPMCGIMLDVDYFKKVNDTYGHAAGDCVLKQVSQLIKNEIREYDIACRYGGEEFFIILPQTVINEASLVAQRLRKVIEEVKMDIREAGVEDVSYIKVTVSLGVCAFDKDMTADLFVQKADKALYEAKTSGRNRVIVN